ncbi:uncharacterized protein BO66DRAFT_149598 [Aspergillus aculeatinus CBS 121060]|uniref:Uncharacterized protein n=1 Tax=Aspergillus aculeatinus CBS 121060 TaxID=1448322 RepID=A0ACD1H2B5_9EURO|nr:hypothetical protein BO66DRAFT_149598 [Aspergillus aculeatinus CBS 121060]RAH67649.1 hypothetical protein BO66DRAFT_149598 [Aspergillus aculeatinus CBS 121060]
MRKSGRQDVISGDELNRRIMIPCWRSPAPFHYFYFSFPYHALWFVFLSVFARAHGSPVWSFSCFDGLIFPRQHLDTRLVLCVLPSHSVELLFFCLLSICSSTPLILSAVRSILAHERLWFSFFGVRDMLSSTAFSIPSVRYILFFSSSLFSLSPSLTYTFSPLLVDAILM